MSQAWSFPSPAPSGGPGSATLTLIEGETFCISARNGDILPGTAQGLFDRDTRFLSRLELLVNDAAVEYLALLPSTPFSAGVLGRSRPAPGRADSTLLVFRHRYVGRGMREDIVLRNAAIEPAAITLTLLLAADFAHLFEVKDDRIKPRGETRLSTYGPTLKFDFSWRGLKRGVTVTLNTEEASAAEDAITARLVVPARSEWRACLQVTTEMDSGPVEPSYRCGQAPDTAAPLHRLHQWRESTPLIHCENAGFNRTLRTTEEDLGSLRIFDPEFPDQAVVAAGAPWFMTLFGRDSLITSWMALLADPGLAEGTLRSLSRYQGSKVDPLSEEEPGRIPHEMRWGLAKSLARGSGSLYYGTADATPLFVMLLGELRRWGLSREIVDELLPHADRALEWIQSFGDRDGDGFVEYRRATDEGLINQGWKDSFDGISFRNGRLAEAPIALCEVQGYAYAAYLARAHFAAEAGEKETVERWTGAAEALKTSFNEQFWLTSEGYFAVGLDGDKKPIDSITSNVGHCLWTGIVDEEKAAQVAERLVSSEMFSGFGVRTLSSEMGLYNPVSYHNGSVWPHDNALIVAGLMRYGFVDAAERIMTGIIDAAEHFDGRLPELFSGLPRAQFPAPVSYPTACSPQAWAAATPLGLVRSMLRFDPWIPQDRLWLAPAVPAKLGELTVANVPLAGNRLFITVRDGIAEVQGSPTAVAVHSAPRRPLHQAYDRERDA
jgi:glycogen debranching enzyme